MNRKEAQERISELTDIANAYINEAFNLAKDYLLGFSYVPPGQGYYEPPFTKEAILRLIETGDYDSLDKWEKERAERVLEEGDEEDDWQETWQTSFC